MSQGYACRCEPRDRATWVVYARRCNHSAFNGYQRTPSRYSEVGCALCLMRWRTMAAYVDELPDAGPEPRDNNYPRRFVR